MSNVKKEDALLLSIAIKRERERERERDLVQHNNNLLQKTGMLSLSDVADFFWDWRRFNREDNALHTFFFFDFSLSQWILFTTWVWFYLEKKNANSIRNQKTHTHRDTHTVEPHVRGILDR